MTTRSPRFNSTLASTTATSSAQLDQDGTADYRQVQYVSRLDTYTLERNEQYSRMLHRAAWDGDTVQMEQLLTAGQNPDTGNEWHMTPIMTVLMRHGMVVTRCIFQERRAIQRNLVVDVRGSFA